MADVVGYSRMMRADESATLDRLNRLRQQVIEARLEGFGGRLVKETGDGFLAEFHSAVDAVQYAVDVQRELRRRNVEAVAVERMQLRIGINVGDIIVQGDDLFGDGVNVAARIEGVALPGGICISATVYDQVRDKLDLAYEDKGLREVKNLSEPVRTYSVGLDPANGAGQPGPRSVIADTPSIAVLPFDNMSGSADQDYFSDGITEDIITDLSKLSSLMVIARNSSFTYKGRAVDVKQVARELGVRHVLEGSVRRAGNRVRVTAQLIDGSTGGHVWAERYDRVLEDIFAIQDEITMNIVDELRVRLNLDERERLAPRPQPNVEAYDLVLRGRDLLGQITRDRYAEATKLFQQALEIDPKLTYAYSGMAFANILAYVNNWTESPDKTLDFAVEMAHRSVEADPENAHAYRALAVALLWKRDIDGANAALENAYRLSPGDAETLVTKGNMAVYMHEPDLAIAKLEKARVINPRFPDMVLHFLAHAYFMKREYETANGYLEERIRLVPGTDISRVLLASSYGHLGRVEDARRVWNEMLAINPSYSLEHKGRVLPYKDPGDWENYLEGLRKAGLVR